MTQYAPNPPQQTQRPSNGLGLTGFIVGLIGLLISFIPLVGVVAWPLVILGIIFSAIGIAKAVKGRATNKGLAITGLVVSIAGLVVCILWVAIWNKAVDEVNEEANREAVIVYEVTGDAPIADVTYSTYGDEVTTNDETGVALPWTKEVSTTGIIKEGSLIVTTGAEGGTVTCTITVDGKQVDSQSASGPFEIATCASI